MKTPASRWRRSRGWCVALFVTFLLMPACGGGGGGSQTTASATRTSVTSVDIPVETGDGWSVASLAEVGMVEQPLVNALNAIHSGNYGEIHGLVIIKNGKLVLEHYGRGRMYDGSPDDRFTPVMDFDRDTLHIVHSVSKSYLSTLLGIAIRDGYIAGADTSVLSFFPEHSSPARTDKEAITLRHLMTMSSGLEWNEWDVAAMDFANNDAMRYQQAPDPSEYFFDKALIHEPGETFYYNTAGFQMLGEVIRRSTGTDLTEFARQNLFSPIGIESFAWPQFEHGPVYLVGDILLRPRDMAKFGQLLLQDGRWNGMQLVPATWLEQATTDLIAVSQLRYKGYGGYGYFWWLKEFGTAAHPIPAICADGLAGQAILVFPTLDMVVVTTGGNYDSPPREHDLVASYVLPAATSS